MTPVLITLMDPTSPATPRMKHTRTVNHYQGTQAQLAENLGDFYYDSLADFLGLLSKKMARDATADLGRGRPKLAAELDACAQHLDAAARHIQAAWGICAPHVPVAPSPSTTDNP